MLAALIAPNALPKCETPLMHRHTAMPRHGIFHF
jgi:hypothetical protein